MDFDPPFFPHTTGVLQPRRQSFSALDQRTQTQNTNPKALGISPHAEQYARSSRSDARTDRRNIPSRYHQPTPVTPVDLVEKVNGMYRLLDVVGESGSNGHVDKVVIAQDSLQRFINTISPGTYESITKVDFKTLDQLMIKPLGVYGSKGEIVRLLRSIGAVDEDAARLLLVSTDIGDSGSTLSTGLYIVKVETTELADERHYVIYWPEDTTWDDSAAPSVCRNRITFMRFLTKICDQIAALFSPEHSASIILNHEDSDIESVDVDTDDFYRVFTFEVAETNEQEENAGLRPGFQMNSRYISPYETPIGCPVDPTVFSPRLLPGETKQGILTANYVPPQTQIETIDEQTFSRVSLEHLLKNNTLVLSESLDADAVQTLVSVAIADIFPERCDEWHIANGNAHATFEQEFARRKDVALRDIARKEDSLRRVLREAVVGDVIKHFPSLKRDRLSARVGADDDLSASQEASDSMQLYDLNSLFDGFQSIYQSHVQKAGFESVLQRDTRFKSRKLRLVSILHLLGKHQPLHPEMRANLIRSVLFEGNFRLAQRMLPKVEDKEQPNTSTRGIGALFTGPSNPEDTLERDMKKLAAGVSDSQFLLDMKAVGDEEMRTVIEQVDGLAYIQLGSSINKAVMAMTSAVLEIQQQDCRRSIQHKIESEERKLLSEDLTEFIRDINARSVGRRDSVVYVDRVDVRGRKLIPWRRGREYMVTGRREAPQESKLELRVHPMELTSDDKHNMQLDPNYVPKPVINDRLSSAFSFTIHRDIAFYQILEHEKFLFILLDRDRVVIYLDHLPAMDLTIQRDSAVKCLNREKLGDNLLFAFDETKRALVVCASAKLQLHMFVFGDGYKTLQAQRSAIDLAPWYSQTGISILHVAFVCGSEEVVLVDSSSQARIFSFVTLQFRPASVQLPLPPSSILSSPDGSCLLVLHIQDAKSFLTVYHWETFGSTAGIRLDVPEFPLQGAVLTSMVNRGHIFLMGLNINSGSVQSIAVDITKKATEFMFKENGNRHAPNNRTRHTLHNSLLYCHAEVWSRFPVIPAVRRRLVTSSSERLQKTLTFITEEHHRSFSSYFSGLIQTFENTTKKPTGDELRRIKVSAKDFTSFRDEVIMSHSDVSCYRIGEWLVDLLCLIPIQIAVCRENRFVPLADGVLSSDLERSLLGAEVSKIVDRLSFGWYESIFQSYLATKPVKVVSSMGQQSVGKSFALNHLLDTSFAGSAMRTTEGVWMSVTPTDDALIVALDFEGVDSVERSLQEDTLLVLFNTAISNLVLFRNNFAFSRDISGLFQSFQSSASVLNPSANPSLFQSTLLIIIKDVVESDKNEITREFSLKFQKIVQQEQKANFISRLHRGKLGIIPWPVIESKEFYMLFSALKKRLDRQEISHPSAGEFLHTMKILMAKLKANDWGAFSQTATEHRARTLSALLPIALATGYSEVEPDLEPLKNLDTDLIVEGDDSATVFSLSDGERLLPADIEAHLAKLRESWGMSTPRQSMHDSDWTSKLASHIEELINLRVNHVRLWLDSNLQRFQAGHATINNLHRRFDNMVIEMKMNARLCRAQCASCHLLCVLNRFHEGDHSCETTHTCLYNCRFCEGDSKTCSIPAGHPGEHVCAVNTHLCGEPCKLSGRRGCLEDCMKVAGHAEEEHICSALVHMCGEPCALQEMRLPEGMTYSCQEGCSVPSDQSHEVHSCDMRLCPMTCDLCKRLCVLPHLHGLAPSVVHSCGEAHSCSALCSAPGVCQIDITPHSIEATFTGRHETFQYTKYSQVARRLQCAKTIEPWQISHTGSHIHTGDARPFHFCETRCKNCGYFCTLPNCHTQQEHETSHGSMTQTRWTIEGPDGIGVELRGRKFASNDEGTPMMCNLVCSSIGRHVHIDYCRTAEGTPCGGTEIQHINARMIPDPDKSKDAITHRLYWHRMGFKDPYTHDEQTDFRKCDAMCSGPDHAQMAGSGRPSYCTLPMFHAPKNPNVAVNGHGYTSADGHLFECNSPTVLQQSFHVIFIIDRSSSMASTDRQPLSDVPVTERIKECASNRLGAVYSALYGFWSARHASVTAGQDTLSARLGLGALYSALYGIWSGSNSAATMDQRATGTRRDAYSVILFNHTTKVALTNDFTSSPDQLLGTLLTTKANGGTNFASALCAAEAVMVGNWSTERTPVMIFLSDGECTVSDKIIKDVCRSAVQRGKPLSFHAISFGQDSLTATLRRMAELALEIQKDAPRSPMLPVIPSSFSTALDTVQLTETFLGIAESLRNPRGSLVY